MRIKKTIYIFLGLAIIGAGVWYFQTSNKEDAAVSSAPTDLKPISVAADIKHSSVVTSTSNELTSRALNNSGIGLFNEPVRSLLRSDKMAKLDYARLRVNTQCLSFLSPVGAAKTVEDSANAVAKLSETDKLLYGRATPATRQIALSRSIEACSKLFEGSPLSADEWVAFNAQPNTSQWRRLVKAGQKENFGSDAVATKEFMEKIISEPMLGAMEGFLYAGLANSGALTKDYPPEQASALRILAVPFLLCQMGDDCRSGGIVSEQLCWQSGICGENVQDAILEHLRSQQINTAVFEQFLMTMRQNLEKFPLYLKQLGLPFRK